MDFSDSSWRIFQIQVGGFFRFKLADFFDSSWWIFKIQVGRFLDLSWWILDEVQAE